MGRASQRGALGPGSRGAIERTTSMGPAARGVSRPLALPAGPQPARSFGNWNSWWSIRTL